ncbi:MAG: DNA-directed RNA polymerase subunit omega [Eubacteriales bacterium]|nr:DNA-directed RNA polymerase subunit omega [Eubacteriales bacterium]
MMIYPSIDDLRRKVDSKYTLCILAAKRARDLIDGAPDLLEPGKATSERKVSIASEEIEENLITYKAADEGGSEDAEDASCEGAEDTAEAAQEDPAEAQSPFEAAEARDASETGTDSETVQ